MPMKIGFLTSLPKRTRRRARRFASTDRPHVAVAPGLLEHEHVVVREDDDTDADYRAGKALLTAALDFARKG